MTRRRGRRHKKLLDDLKDRRVYSNLKEEPLDLSSDRLLNERRFVIVSTGGFSGVKNFKYTSWIFVLHL